MGVALRYKLLSLLQHLLLTVLTLPILSQWYAYICR